MKAFVNNIFSVLSCLDFWHFCKRVIMSKWVVGKKGIFLLSVSIEPWDRSLYFLSILLPTNASKLLSFSCINAGTSM